ncbi:MAG: hypothetical protein NTZ81_08995 [Actinobacteria bacterium]|nr:hypothetical protein [Actinomycetota bacterium]
MILTDDINFVESKPVGDELGVVALQRRVPVVRQQHPLATNAVVGGQLGAQFGVRDLPLKVPQRNVCPFLGLVGPLDQPPPFLSGAEGEKARLVEPEDAEPVQALDTGDLAEAALLRL